ncbi:MAG TPA: hypothetical protein VGQ90_04085, partial [Stellaceae bacterium]|nr:hypothetical protein [Stellaceae bacterium]
MRVRVIGLAAALFAAIAAPPPASLAASTTPALDRLQRADGVQIVPERFLRRWDPVTVFFDRDIGPAGGGPEDQPQTYATIAPAPAGAWQWLGPRVLQFRPAEPWQPLRRGHYLIEARMPADAETALVQPVVVGIAPRP